MIVSKDRICKEYLHMRAFLPHEDAVRKTAEQLFMLEYEVEQIIQPKEETCKLA